MRKKETKKISNNLKALYIVAGVALLILIAGIIFWFSKEFPKLFEGGWHFTF